jgi:hypothetical protein
MEKKIKMAYIHPSIYPHPAANALQAITMAAAFSQLIDTTFIIPGTTLPLKKLKQHYGILGSPLGVQSLYLIKFPDRFGKLFNQLTAYYLQVHPKWSWINGIKILFVRRPEELLFWNLERKKNSLFKDWIFIYEAHDGFERLERDILVHSLLSFDLVISLTQLWLMI